MSMIPTKLAAARFKATSVRPYLSAGIWALIPVESKGLGTLGVDKHWRMYYDPDVIETWSVDEIAGVLYHEISHLLRDHCYRAEDMGTSLDPLTAARWNIAGDCLAPQTMVLMADGSEKQISKVKPGDRIIGWQNGKLTVGVVMMNIARPKSGTGIALRVNSRTIYSTDQHRFLTESGYVDARRLSTEADSIRKVCRLRVEIYFRESKEYDDRTAGVIPRSQLREFVRLSSKIWSLLSKKDREAHLKHKLLQTSGPGVGLSSWDRRRGGHRYGSSTIQQPYEQNLLSTNSRNKQYEYGLEGLDISKGDVGTTLHEYQRNTVLEIIDGWIESGGCASGIVAIPYCQKIAGKTCDRVLRTTADTEAPFETYSEDVTNISGVASVEYAVYSSERVSIEEGSIYHDLVTTCHSFVAEGVICHNCEINDELKAEGVTLPVFKDKDGKEVGNAVYPSTYGFQDNQFVEEYYNLLEDKMCQDELEIELVYDPGSGNGSGSSSDGSKDDSKGGGGAQPSPSGSGDSSKPSGKPGAGSRPGPIEKNGRRRVTVRVHCQRPGPGGGNCGSCASGHKAPWELDGPDDKNGNGQQVPGITRTEGKLIQQDVARRILEDSKACGNIPAGWKRWAEKRLDSKVDWRKEIPACIRNALAQASGMTDYTYRRPSRRQSSYGDVVAPSLYRPVPRIGIGIDTSGSMSDTKICQCLAEVQGVLKSLGVAGSSVVVMFADTKVHAVSKVFDARSLVPLGGGGTSMPVFIEHARTLRPRIDVLFILTDAESPWDPTPPDDIKVIIGRMGTGHVPPGYKVIDIDV